MKGLLLGNWEIWITITPVLQSKKTNKKKNICQNIIDMMSSLASTIYVVHQLNGNVLWGKNLNGQLGNTDRKY